jgi:hypothetical protein
MEGLDFVDDVECNNEGSVVAQMLADTLGRRSCMRGLTL